MTDLEKQIAAHNILHKEIQAYSSQLCVSSAGGKVRRGRRSEGGVNPLGNKLVNSDPRSVFLFIWHHFLCLRRV